MNPCKVCVLDQEHRTAIDDALSSGVPLDTISHKCGIGRSSLHRHFHRHLRPDKNEPGPKSHGSRRTVQTTPVSASAKLPDPPELTAIVRGRQRDTDTITSITVAGSSSGQSGENDGSAQTSTKAELLGRLEYLWHESLDGLDATKEAIRIEKANGSVIELPGDLRARAGFIREGRQVLELVAAANGDLSAGHAEARILIVLPVMTVRGDKNSDDCVVDIEPGR